VEIISICDPDKKMLGPKPLRSPATAEIEEAGRALP